MGSLEEYIMPASKTISPGGPATLRCRAYPAGVRDGLVPGAVVARPHQAARIALATGTGAPPTLGCLTSIEVNACATVQPAAPVGTTVKLDLRKYTLIRAAGLPDFL